MKALVDTSIWSLAFRRQSQSLDSRQLKLKALLSSLIDDGRIVMIGPVRQELLSGIRDQAQFRELRGSLAHFLDFQLRTSDYERAAEMSNACTSKGVANTPTDMLICSVAHAEGIGILTTDRDFVAYARCVPIKLFADELER